MNTTDAITKLEAIAKLPEKWRNDMQYPTFGPIFAQFLEASLGSLPVEPVPEVPADPYARLKQAFNSGRRIRVRLKDDELTPWTKKGEGVFEWIEPPNRYEIEPLPADSSAEKAAPVSKWTDEQLGEIGAKSAWMGTKDCDELMTINPDAMFWEQDEAARTAFARAVREAVEKECNRSMQNGLYQAIVNKLKPILGENSRELEWDILPFTFGKLIAAKRIPDAGQAKKIGEQAEEIARLTAELEACDQARKNACDDRDAARAELAKANAELERLRWRPVSVKPTREDADPEGYVLICGMDGKCRGIHDIKYSFGSHDSHWMPFPNPPPAPTAEEKERAEFEAFWNDCHLQHLINKEGAFKIWTASRLPKQKP